MSETKDELIGATEAARLIGVSTVRLRRDLDGVLAPLIEHGRRRYARAAVLAYAEDRQARIAARDAARVAGKAR
jgi:hypothetical protein